jgi:hypothetical protein
MKSSSAISTKPIILPRLLQNSPPQNKFAPRTTHHHARRNTHHASVLDRGLLPIPSPVDTSGSHSAPPLRPWLRTLDLGLWTEILPSLALPVVLG